MKKYLIVTNRDAARELTHVFNKWGIHSIHIITQSEVEKVRGMEYCGAEIHEGRYPYQLTAEELSVIQSRIR